MRKRPDSTTPCNHEIEDSDINFQKIVSLQKDTRCVPPFWKKKLQGILELKECTTPTQLKRIYRYINNYKEVLANYTAPCIDMYNAVAWNWNLKQEKPARNQAVIKFFYQEKYYEEIKYSKAFDVEGFISNLGGFVGIFLGYSLMQLPGLLGRFIIWSFYVACSKWIIGRLCQFSVHIINHFMYNSRCFNILDKGLGNEGWRWP